MAAVVWAGDLLLAYPFDLRAQNRINHDLGELALKGLVGPEGDAAARKVAEALKAAVADHGRRYGDSTSLAKALFQRQPRAALDILVQGGEAWPRLSQVVWGLESDPDDASEHQPRGPIHALDLSVAKAWVAEDPATRTERLALAIPFAERGKDAELTWTPLASDLLNGPYGVSALDAFYPRFFPSMSWGEYGSGWVRRRPLLSCLFGSSSAALVAAARKFSVALEERIAWAASLTWPDEDQTFE